MRRPRANNAPFSRSQNDRPLGVGPSRRDRRPRSSAARAKARPAQSAETKGRNKNRIEGSLRRVEGAAKVAVGKTIRDANFASEGRENQAVGNIQTAVGRASDAVRETVRIIME